MIWMSNEMVRLQDDLSDVAAFIEAETRARGVVIGAEWHTMHRGRINRRIAHLIAEPSDADGWDVLAAAHDCIRHLGYRVESITGAPLDAYTVSGSARDLSRHQRLMAIQRFRGVRITRRSQRQNS